MAGQLDPVQYEIFRHRLFQILEEGRIAIKMVSGSPVVVEGGETMCAFYTSNGIPILSAAGILLHCTGARDFILKALQWYEEDPGIHDGDQFFFNDPYIGGAHLPDQIVIKPIFYKGRRIAWTGSFMHTPETGGLEPGGMMATSREIFHEGIRILGLKIVEGGRFRPDVFRSIVGQVRDPHLVGLDLKAKVAANNICARRYLALVERYGLDLVEAASQRIIADSESMARARLRSLPDGTWRSRFYGDPSGVEERPFRVVCTMTKEGEEITFDFTGSSPQQESSMNSTLACSWGSLFVVLAGLLFWKVPWNGGMIAPVRLIAPEGSVVNCRFPAACSRGVIGAGMMLSATAHECVAKMLYAAGYEEDVNAGWCGLSAGGLNLGGINQYGAPMGGTILDTFALGCGAAPSRDGTNSGGQLMNPTSNISDVEIIEMNLPVMYLGRWHARDSGGFGRFAGGMGLEAIYMVHGTDQFRLGLRGGGRRAPGGWGLFGGYPPALLEARMVRDSNLPSWLQRSHYPQGFAEVDSLQGEVLDLPSSFAPIPMREGDLLLRRIGAGGGYGDPLDRDPEAVARDLRDGAISRETVEGVYEVAFRVGTLQPDPKATGERRRWLQEERQRAKKALTLSAGVP